jgi:1,4-dihydroxy-2-naphthoyl-CoA synthase
MAYNLPIIIKKPEEFAFKDIVYTKEAGLATIRINRPEEYNSYTTWTLKEIVDALQDAEWDSEIALVVITGTADKAFCTGGNVKEYSEIYTKNPNLYYHYMGFFSKMIEGILNLSKVSLAMLNGIAVGGGNEINCACLLSAIVKDAKGISQIGSNVGSVACGGATQWLDIIVGHKNASEMLSLNEFWSPEKSLEKGLVNWVIDRKNMDSFIKELLDKVKNKFPECTRKTLIELNHKKRMAWYESVKQASDWLAMHFYSFEPACGMGAFANKKKVDYANFRKALFSGELSSGKKKIEELFI